MKKVFRFGKRRKSYFVSYFTFFQSQFHFMKFNNQIMFHFHNISFSNSFHEILQSNFVSYFTIFQFQTHFMKSKNQILFHISQCFNFKLISWNRTIKFCFIFTMFQFNFKTKSRVRTNGIWNISYPYNSSWCFFTPFNYDVLVIIISTSSLIFKIFCQHFP